MALLITWIFIIIKVIVVPVAVLVAAAMLIRYITKKNKTQQELKQINSELKEIEWELHQKEKEENY